MNQPRLLFHFDVERPETDGLPKAPTLEEIRACFESPIHPFNAYNKIVGQETAKKKLRRVTIDAYLKIDHNCGDCNFLVTGPSSVGKTTIVRAFADSVRLPFIEVSPRALETIDDLLGFITHVLGNRKPPLNLVPTIRANFYELPPCIIFIDEAHALRKNLQNELLKAVERHDRSFITEAGETISTKNVCWFFATTEVGDLFGPLLNRFTEINLKPYTKHEVAKIVQMNFPDLTEEICKTVAHFESKVTRRALAFATELMRELQQRPEIPLQKLAAELAEENDVDQHGMEKRHLHILKLVSVRAIPKDRLALNLHVTKEELERLIVPPLLLDTEDAPALLTVTGKGYEITQAGAKELQKRGIECKRTPCA